MKIVVLEKESIHKCEEFLNLEPKAREGIQGFSPTRYELIELVKFWHKQRMQFAWDFFMTGCAGSIEASIETFAKIRIGQIREVICERDVEQAISEANKEFSKTVNPRNWELFLYGTESERDTLRKELRHADVSGLQ